MRRRPPVRLLAILAGVAGSGFFAYLAIRDVDFDLFAATLRASDYWWLAPALAVHFAAVAVRVVRWRQLFAPETRPPLGAVGRAVLIGYLFNDILPARAGEAARVVALYQAAGTSRSETVATAITERVWDVFALLVLLVAAAPFLPEETWLRRAVVLSIVLGAALAAGAVVLKRYEERPLTFALRPLGRALRIPASRVEGAGRSFVRGLEGFRRPRAAALAFGLTVISWLVVALSFWLAIVGLKLGVGFAAALLIVIATNLAFLIPSLPAAVGVFEAATLAALHPFGVDDSRALSCAVVLHSLVFFPFLAVGAVALHRHAVALRSRGRVVLPRTPERPASSSPLRTPNAKR